MNKRKKSALGNNPLADINPSSVSIFSKTSVSKASQTDKAEKEESRIKNQESIVFNLTNKDLEKEKINLRLPLELNDWLDSIVKRSKRLHGHKIPKEIWVQSALELFKSLPIDWESVDSIEELQNQIQYCSNKLK